MLAPHSFQIAALGLAAGAIPARQRRASAAAAMSSGGASCTATATDPLSGGVPTTATGPDPIVGLALSATDGPSAAVLQPTRPQPRACTITSNLDAGGSDVDAARHAAGLTTPGAPTCGPPALAGDLGRDPDEGEDAFSKLAAAGAAPISQLTEQQRRFGEALAADVAADLGTTAQGARAARGSSGGEAGSGEAPPWWEHGFAGESARGACSGEQVEDGSSSRAGAVEAACSRADDDEEEEGGSYASERRELLIFALPLTPQKVCWASMWARCSVYVKGPAAGGCDDRSNSALHVPDTYLQGS
jgi:hypothetical protein